MENFFGLVEDDMQINQSNGDWLQSIYDNNPLLGSKVIPQDQSEKINSKCRTLLESLLDNSQKQISLKSKMLIAFAVINIAKRWDSESEQGFWKFIALNLGFKDYNDRFRNVITDIIKTALQSNRRWFYVSQNNANRYKSSIMVHALAPRKCWFSFFDFLFDFYKNNLNWEYIENDPLIPSMLASVGHKFKNEDAGDEEIVISSKIYSFQEGIRKLIIHKPLYAATLCYKMLKRIDDKVNNSTCSCTCYEEQLCDEWFSQKLSEIPLKESHRKGDKRRIIALNYKTIKPYYRLFDNSNVKIVFPDVRLKQSVFSSLHMDVYCGERIVDHCSLQYYGNEFGKTMTGFEYPLEDYLRDSRSAKFDPKIIIRLDDEEIYNSNDTLFRDLLVFKNNLEISVGSCTANRYSVFSPTETEVKYQNAVISEIVCNDILKGNYVELDEDFCISLSGKPIAMGKIKSGEIQVEFPVECGVRYIENEVDHTIVLPNVTMNIAFSKNGMEHKYAVFLNDERLDWNEIFSTRFSETVVYSISFGEITANVITVRIADLEREITVCNKHFKIIHGFNFSFNRQFYFSANDYIEAVLHVETVDNYSSYPVQYGENQILVPYDNGYLEFVVPIIQLDEKLEAFYRSGIPIFVNDIQQNLFVDIFAPENVDVDLKFGGKSVSQEKRCCFSLGNALLARSTNGEKSLTLSLEAKSKNDNRKYKICEIALEEQFISEPLFLCENRVLKWDSGRGFIGKEHKQFILVIEYGKAKIKLFPQIGQSLVSEKLDIPLGEHKYSLFVESENLFVKTEKKLSSGILTVGSKNELRFLNKMISVNTVIGSKSQNNFESVIKISPVFIDKLRYIGMQSEEGVDCPMYEGIMFYRTKYGRRNFSFDDSEDSNGKKRYMVNPVKVVYINDSSLIITNSDNDGLYYRRDFYKSDFHFKVTDFEPSISERDKYDIVDFYLYTKEDL